MHVCELCLVTSTESAQSLIAEMFLLTDTHKKTTLGTMCALLEYLKSATYMFKCKILSWTLMSGWHTCYNQE